MYVSVEIDAEDVVSELDDDQLKRLGLQRVPAGSSPDPDRSNGNPLTRDVHWHGVGDAIRRRDFDRATQLLSSIVAVQGHSLPPFVLAPAA